jgi:hypothetical protein
MSLKMIETNIPFYAGIENMGPEINGCNIDKGDKGKFNCKPALNDVELS